MKNAALIAVALVLLAGNVWQYFKAAPPREEEQPSRPVLALPTPGGPGGGEVADLTRQLREEQAERTRQTQRAESLSTMTKQQQSRIADLEERLAALEAGTQGSGATTPVPRAQPAPGTAETAAPPSGPAPGSAETAPPPPGPAPGTAETAASPPGPAPGTLESTAQPQPPRPVSAPRTVATAAPAPPRQEASRDEPSAEPRDVEYVVKSGDMLQSIARRYYGNSTQWRRILEANRDVVSSPRALRPGMKLTIPGVSRGRTNQSD